MAPWPKIRNALLAILVFVSLGICGAVALNRWIDASERQQSSYSSLSDTAKDGAIDRGWIPDFLPESSRSIQEVSDLSPSRVWCAFQFDLTDAEKLRKNLRSVDSLAPSREHVPNPGVPWWPRVLQGSLDMEKIRRADYSLYTATKDETLLFAIDWSTGHGYFYGH